MRKHLQTLGVALLLAPIMVLFLPAENSQGLSEALRWGPSELQRLFTSVWLALAAGTVACVAAFPLLPLLARERSMARPWVCLPLIVLATPPFLIASGLIALPARLASYGGARFVIPPVGTELPSGGISTILFGPVGCLFSYALAFWPIPFLVAGMLRKPFSRSAEFSVQLLAKRSWISHAGRKVFWQLDWPRLWPGYAAGGMLVTALVLGDSLVAEIHQMDTVMLDVSLNLAGQHDIAGSALSALPLTLLIFFVVFAMSYLLKRSGSWSQIAIGEDKGPTGLGGGDGDEATPASERFDIRPFLPLLVLTAVSLGVPLLSLSLGVHSWHSFLNGLRSNINYFKATLIYSLCAALVLVWLAARNGMRWAECYGPPGRGARLFTFAALLLVLLPEPLIAVGMARCATLAAKLFSLLGLAIDPRATRLMVIAGLVWRWLIIAAGLAWYIRLRLHRTILRALACGMTAKRSRICISWPESFLPLTAAFLLIVVLTSGDAVVTKFVMPPGGDSLAVVFYDLLHYGMDEQTAAAGLLLLVLPLVVLIVIGKIWNRAKEIQF